MWKHLWVGGLTLALAPVTFGLNSIEEQLPPSDLSLNTAPAPQAEVSPTGAADFNNIDAEMNLQVENDMYGPQQGQWEVTFSGNGSSDEDFDTNVFGLSGSIGYYLTDDLLVALRQSLNISDNGDDSTRGSTRVALDYHFDLDRFRPFVGANFGGVYGDGINDTFAAGLEGGLKWYVKPEVFLFGMIEYQWLFDDADDVNNTFDDGQWIYTFGVGFNF
jgi:hypothetical protein